ncbi:MAG: succinate dehydrogenase assembly factor 2 [Sulfuricella sp.]|nr:succinate dehydrogenase assembly factor 2 [Sulfuricella sp.]
MRSEEFGLIRWNCRRGMLELDIVLARFLERELARLTPREAEAFNGLLAYPDHDLWGMIQDGEACGDAETERVLQLLRRS